MKVLKKNEIIKLRQVEHTVNEKMILEMLDFPFLVKTLGTMQDSNNLYIVLEYIAGGELFSYLRKSGVRLFLSSDSQITLRVSTQLKLFWLLNTCTPRTSSTVT